MCGGRRGEREREGGGGRKRKREEGGREEKRREEGAGERIISYCVVLSIQW